jgi:hypothetical protein
VIVALLTSVMVVRFTSYNKTSLESSCDPPFFINTVKPILDKPCNTARCHYDPVFTSLNKYQTVHDGERQNKISIQVGRMPKGGRLNSANINAIFCWIDNGANNN